MQHAQGRVACTLRDWSYKTLAGFGEIQVNILDLWIKRGLM